MSQRISAQKDLVDCAAERVAEIQDELNAKEVMEPNFSPWGKVQSCHALCDGVFFVDTDSHGGIMVDKDVAHIKLSWAAIKCGCDDGIYYCFEENRDAQVVLRELMDRKMIQVPFNKQFPQGKYESLIDADVQRYHPQYWSYRKHHLLPALQYSHENNKKERDR